MGIIFKLYSTPSILLMTSCLFFRTAGLYTIPTASATATNITTATTAAVIVVSIFLNNNKSNSKC